MDLVCIVPHSGQACGAKLGDHVLVTQIPIVLYFGDYIPETPSKNLGDENWRVRLQMARKFVETLNRHGAAEK